MRVHTCKNGVCMYVRIYTYAYIYIYVCVCVCNFYKRKDAKYGLGRRYRWGNKK